MALFSLTCLFAIKMLKNQAPPILSTTWYDKKAKLPFSKGVNQGAAGILEIHYTVATLLQINTISEFYWLRNFFSQSHPFKNRDRLLHT